MTETRVDVLRCGACHVAFVPPRSRCPRCGSAELTEGTVPAHGEVLAATELAFPPPGFPAPHRLVLVELEEGVRVLATSPAAHARGSAVHVTREGATFRATS